MPELRPVVEAPAAPEPVVESASVVGDTKTVEMAVPLALRPGLKLGIAKAVELC